MSAKPTGTFCWADLMPGEQPRAEAFYAALAGWHTGPKHPDFDYAMQFLGDDAAPTQVAGISGGMEGVPPAWNLYFASDDFAATQAAIEAAGGRAAMESFEIPGSGIGGFFLDPTGIAFGVWQSKGHDGFGPFATPGAFCWAEAYSRDAAATRDFLGAAFGLQSTTLSETDEFTYFQLSAAGVSEPTLGVMQVGETLPTGESRPHLLAYLAVTDADAAAAQVTDLGGTIVREPFDSPYGRIALVRDTEGALLSLVDPTRTGS